MVIFYWLGKFTFQDYLTTAALKLLIGYLTNRSVATVQIRQLKFNKGVR